ncbi:MAG: hypothetical protein IPN34_02690 [Planctomycetes bacterium]|nr:hypothetical protein [Planctomycetota bacterium]
MRSHRSLPRRSRTFELWVLAVTALATPSCFYLDHEATYETREVRRELEPPRLELAPKLIALPGERLRLEAPAQRQERHEVERWSDEGSSFDLILASVTADLFSESEEDDEMLVLLAMPFTLAWDLLLPVTGTFYNLGDWALTGGSTSLGVDELNETRAANPSLRLEDASGSGTTLTPDPDGAFELGLEDLAAAGFRGPQLRLRGPADQELRLPLAPREAARLERFAAETPPLPAGPRVDIAAGADLAAAIASAPRGAVLVLGPGTHELRGDVSVPDGLTLSGTSAARTVLRCAADDARLTVAADATVALLDLTLDRGSSSSPASLELRGHVRCTRCSFRAEQSGSAILARERAELVLERCRFRGFTEGATLWWEDARGSVDGCQFRACEAALKIGDRAAPELGENEFGEIEKPIAVDGVANG